MGAYSYSGTAASNTSIDGIGAAGTNSPANLDDLHRAQAAALANFVRDLGGANTVGGTADAITVALADATTLPAYFDGMIVGAIIGTDNATTTPTLNVDSVGAKVIKKASAGAEADLAAGDLQAGSYVLFRYRSAWAAAAGAWEALRFDAATLPQSLSTVDAPTFADLTITDDLTVGDDINLASGSIISWNSGDITLAHGANYLNYAGGSINYYYDNASFRALGAYNNADNASVPVASFEGDRATPTDGDAAYIDLKLSDSAGNQDTFVRLTWTGVDITSTTEDGSLKISVVKAGSLTDVMTLDSTGFQMTNGAGVYSLLGTITTTSGATQSLGSLTLTNYKFLRFVFNGVSHNDGSNRFLTLDSIRISSQEGAGDAFSGIVDLDLTTGIAEARLGITSGGTVTVYMADTAYTTASTSVVVGISGGAFDAGSVKVYAIS